MTIRTWRRSYDSWQCILCDINVLWNNFYLVNLCAWVCTCVHLFVQLNFVPWFLLIPVITALKLYFCCIGIYITPLLRSLVILITVQPQLSHLKWNIPLIRLHQCEDKQEAWTHFFSMAKRMFLWSSNKLKKNISLVL